MCAILISKALRFTRFNEGQFYLPVPPTRLSIWNQWRRSLYAIWPLAYHLLAYPFTKWYANPLNWRTTFC